MSAKVRRQEGNSPDCLQRSQSQFDECKRKFCHNDSLEVGLEAAILLRKRISSQVEWQSTENVSGLNHCTESTVFVNLNKPPPTPLYGGKGGRKIDKEVAERSVQNINLEKIYKSEVKMLTWVTTYHVMNHDRRKFKGFFDPFLDEEKIGPLPWCKKHTRDGVTFMIP